MHCASCVESIEKSLNNVNGVREASVNLATNKAIIRFDETVSSPSDLENAIIEAGYTPLIQKVTSSPEPGHVKFKVIGMNSSHCEGVVTKVISNLNGVRNVQASFGSALAVIDFDPLQISGAEIKQAIDEAGYEAVDQKSSKEDLLAMENSG
mgnify:CR=1 FL=1